MTHVADAPVYMWEPQMWTAEELVTALRVAGSGRQKLADEVERRLSLRLTCIECHGTHALVDLDCAYCPECGGMTFTVEPMEHPS